MIWRRQDIHSSSLPQSQRPFTIFTSSSSPDAVSVWLSRHLLEDFVTAEFELDGRSAIP